jgi:MFS family permease
VRRGAEAYLEQLKSLNRDLRLFLFSSGTIGFTLLNGIFPVLFNLYLLRLGYGPAFIGSVNAAGLLAYSLSSFPAGMVARLLGVRRAMALGVTLTMAFSALLPAAELLPVHWRAAWLVGTQVLSTVGLALFFVNASPFMVDATGTSERNHAFSTRMVIDTASGMLGSLVGGALPGMLSTMLALPQDGPAAYRYALITGAMLSLPGVIALLLIREPEPETGGDQVVDAGALPAVPVAMLATMAAVMLLRAAGVGTSRVFFNVYLDDGLGVSTVQIGTLFALVQLASVPAAMAMPLLAARSGLYGVVVWCSLGIAGSMLPLALVPHWAAATIGRLGTYALSAIADPALTVYQLELVPQRWRSLMAGVSSTALGVSWTLLAFGGGYLIAGLGYRTLFLAAAGLTVAGTLLFAGVFHPRSARLARWVGSRPQASGGA